MGRVIVKAKLWNFGDELDFKKGIIKKEQIRKIEVEEAIVDTGATMLTLPEDIVEKLGLTVIREATVTYANNTSAKRKVAAPVGIEILNRSVVTECVVEEKGTKVLIGQIPIEGMDLIIDPKRNFIGPRPESPDIPIIEIYLEA